MIYLKKIFPIRINYNIHIEREQSGYCYNINGILEKKIGYKYNFQKATNDNITL